MPVFPNTFFKGLAVSMLTITLTACATDQRTADGDCYYPGKGVLQILGTAGDAYLQYHEAEAERRYQQTQIERHQIAEELTAVDFNRINYEYNLALANNDTRTMQRLQNERDYYETQRHRAAILQWSIANYQEQKARAIERGSTPSLSQLVDETGC